MCALGKNIKCIDITFVKSTKTIILIVSEDFLLSMWYMYHSCWSRKLCGKHIPLGAFDLNLKKSA